MNSEKNTASAYDPSRNVAHRNIALYAENSTRTDACIEGLYHCRTHNILINTDVNGAYNILYGRRKVAAGSGSRPMAWPMLLKWNTQEWRLSAA